MRLILISLLFALPVSQDAKVESGLKRLGDRTYRITKDGKPAGTFVLKTRVEEKDGGKVAVFEDRIVVKAGDSEETVDFTERASLKGLRLLSATRTPPPGATKERSVEIQKGDAYVTSDRGTQKLKEIEGCVGERALIRLVCLADQKVGARVTAWILVLDPVDYQMGRHIECVAKETLTINGSKMTTFRWEDKREGQSILSGKPVNYKFDNTYWVSLERTLVKFKTDSLEMTVEDK